METPWAGFAFAADVSDVYDRKRQLIRPQSCPAFTADLPGSLESRA